MQNLLFKSPRPPFIFSLGLALALMNVITLRWSYLGDGASVYAYGYPFPWLRWGLASSMEYDVQVLSLTLNLILNLVLILLFWNVFPVKFRERRDSVAMRNALRITGCVLVVSSIIIIIGQGKIYLFSKPLMEPGWKLQKMEFFLGFDRPYNP